MFPWALLTQRPPGADWQELGQAAVCGARGDTGQRSRVGRWGGQAREHGGERSVTSVLGIRHRGAGLFFLHKVLAVGSRTEHASILASLQGGELQPRPE